MKKCLLSDLANKPGDPLLVCWKAERLGFSPAATAEWLRPVGGETTDDNRRGFSPTGHIVRLSEGERVEEIEI